MGATLFRLFAFVFSIGALTPHANADVPTVGQLVGEWQIQKVTYTNLTANETKNVFGDSQLQGGVVYAQAENGLVGNVITIVGVQKPLASPPAITPQEAAALFGQLFASSAGLWPIFAARKRPFAGISDAGGNFRTVPGAPGTH